MPGSQVACTEMSMSNELSGEAGQGEDYPLNVSFRGAERGRHHGHVRLDRPARIYRNGRLLPSVEQIDGVDTDAVARLVAAYIHTAEMLIERGGNKAGLAELSACTGIEERKLDQYVRGARKLLATQ